MPNMRTIRWPWHESKFEEETRRSLAAIQREQEETNRLLKAILDGDDAALAAAVRGLRRDTAGLQRALDQAGPNP
jgi:hypothetical protein